MNSEFIFYIGTTAELIKLAPVIRELKKKKIKFFILTSGQSEIHFEEFNKIIGRVSVAKSFPRKYEKSSIFFFVLWAMRTFVLTLLQFNTIFPQSNTHRIIIVHGDTVSSLIGAVIALLFRIPLAHVESGLRSFDFTEPFPEEICRYIISHIASIHFCPNEWAVKNIRSHNGVKINTIQNTLYDTYRFNKKFKSNKKFVASMKKKKYFVLVLHRQEHVIFDKEQSRTILSFIFQNVSKDMKCVFMVHDLAKYFVHSVIDVMPKEMKQQVYQVNRLPYADFLKLLQHSEFMITDGGSNQEEMFYMGKPCLLLRNKTERIEGLNENVVLSKLNKTTINHFITNYQSFRRKAITTRSNPSGIIAKYLYENV